MSYLSEKNYKTGQLYVDVLGPIYISASKINLESMSTTINGNLNVNSSLYLEPYNSSDINYKLYRQGDNLFWNGTQVNGGGGGSTFNNLNCSNIFINKSIYTGNIYGNTNLNIYGNVFLQNGVLNLKSNLISNGWITINENVPITKANTLYNQTGNLFWNGFQLYKTNQSSLFLEQNNFKWKIEVDSTNGDLVFMKYNGTNYVERQRFA